MNPQTDAQIVQLVLAGDKDSYALLVDAYKDRIINHLARMTGNRYEAEELAQEAFVRAYFALRTYKPQYKFSTWLFKIATNLCINHLKKRKRWIKMDDYQGEEGQPQWLLPDLRAYQSPAVAVAQQELQGQIQDALNQLSPVYRSVVILRHIHGLSYQEIADVTDLPMGTIKSRLGRARRKLTRALQGRV
jgi:RNA polymerase sigma-70 factor (ECF subfamily)